MTSGNRHDRALARRGRVTLTKRRLGDPEGDRIAGPEAVSLVHRLTLASWAFSGRPVRRLARRELPIAFLRGKRT